MNSIERLDPDAAVTIREAIREADGQEVLCVGKVDADGIVIGITIAARGHDTAVPALRPHMEKGDVVIHNHPSGNLRPSDPDLAVASSLGNLGIGFFIVDNLVDRVYVVAEPYLLKEIEPLDVDEISATLGPGGALSRLMDSYEPRDSQVGLLEAVGEAFNEDSICVAEAGTGVGKSMAYLIPAIAWAERNEERVVVSTATINLQQQLVEKDIPLALKLLGSTVKAALVKGRGNYLCLRKLAETREEDSLFSEVDEDLKAIAEWSETTKSGSRSELPQFVGDRVWSKVAAEADGCLAQRCRFRERCFVLQARREAATAQLLVVNHHLLFSDLSVRISGAGFESTAVLPPFQRLIFDEAHNMERSATSYFSETMSRYSLARQLGRLVRRRRGRALGLAVRLGPLVDRTALDADIVGELEALTGKVAERAEALDAIALSSLGAEHTRRFTGDITPEVREALLDPMAELHDALISLIAYVQKILDAVPEERLETPEAYEARIVRERLEGYGSLCQSFSQFDEILDRVFWIERLRVSSGEPFIQFVVTPLDLSGLMREAVFDPYRTVVCTSATLTVKDDFSFWLRRVGLHQFERRSVRTVIFPSPFPYREHVLLGVPSEAPEPTSEQPYLDFVSRFVYDVLELSEGRGLVLFTSYAMLRSVYDAVAVRLSERSITVLKQGDDDRARLLGRFNTEITSVLFATDSFWEGVDAPGETLRVVIICRLPFRVPSDPVIKARMEAIEAAGGNAFNQYALPTAVMRLRQGFGRLMRRSSDRGVVLILDSRIMRKRYGPLFIESLPETQRSLTPSSQLLADVERFLYG